MLSATAAQGTLNHAGSKHKRTTTQGKAGQKNPFRNKWMKEVRQDPFCDKWMKEMKQNPFHNQWMKAAMATNQQKGAPATATLNETAQDATKTTEEATCDLAGAVGDYIGNLEGF